jgi:ribosomal protein L16 Arg81 hydroxylase
MNLQTLLGEIPKSTFVEQYYHRLPFSLAGEARSIVDLGSWQVLGQILIQPNVDLMVVRDGQRYAGPDPRTMDEARALNSVGYTILVRHAESHHGRLKELAAAFEDDFHAPANIHIYATPSGRHGFSWHYDAEEVFILQTSGAKEYSLRKNTVNPWPLVETIPADMRYGREIMPLMRVLLKAGDWLYIPAGYWHMAEARDSEDTAISLALGVMSPSAIDAYDNLRGHLLDSLLWRQRLPVSGRASPLSNDELVVRYRELFQSLAKDLMERLSDELFIRGFLKRWESEPDRQPDG